MMQKDPFVVFLIVLSVVLSGCLNGGDDSTDEDTNKAPVAQIESVVPNPAYAGQTVTFSASGSDEDGFVVDYLWGSSMDGEISTDQQFSIDTLSVGEHTVYLKVTDDEGKWSSKDDLVLTILPENHAPVGNISVSEESVYVGEQINFSAENISDQDGDELSYGWDFGDGNTSSDMKTQHNYSQTGVYDVILVVSDGKNFNGTSLFSITLVINDAFEPPLWEVGRFWTYEVVIPEMEMVTTMVVGDIDETDYHLGSSQLNNAQRHAVLNHNPALGRIRISDMALYEKNVPQLLLPFPLVTGASWNFSLFGVEHFDATVISITDGIASISAESTSVVIDGGEGERLDYVYDRSIGWLTSFVRSETSGSELLRMTLVETGTNYTGEVWFCRGGDLYYEEFIGPDFGYYDTEFANEGHERYGPWDYIVYYLEAEIGSGSGGELILRDHESTDILVTTFSSGNSKNELGTVMGTSGNWTLEISLSGDADVRLLVAGAIQYSWVL